MVTSSSPLLGETSKAVHRTKLLSAVGLCILACVAVTYVAVTSGVLHSRNNLALLETPSSLAKEAIGNAEVAAPASGAASKQSGKLFNVGDVVPNSNAEERMGPPVKRVVKGGAGFFKDSTSEGMMERAYLTKTERKTLKDLWAQQKKLNRDMDVVQKQLKRVSHKKSVVNVKFTRKGPRGDRGQTGHRGPRGNKGLTGPRGNRGPHGARGRVGPRGRRGSRGPPGHTGRRGRRGMRGVRGARGSTGRQGPRGRAGRPGAPGRTGARGPRGQRGPRGVPGRKGISGRVMSRRSHAHSRRAAARRRGASFNHMHLHRRNQWRSSSLGHSRTFTYSFWIYPTASPDGHWRNVLRRGNNDHQRGPGLWMFPRDNRLHLRVGTSRSWNDGVNSRYRLPMRRWTHVAFTTGRGYLRLYINGRQDSYRRMATGSIRRPQGPLVFGAAPYRVERCVIKFFRYRDQWVSGHTVRRMRMRYYRHFRSSIRVRSHSLKNGQFTLSRRRQWRLGAPRYKQYAYTFFVKPSSPRGFWRNLLHRGINGHNRMPALWLFPRDNRLHVRVSTRRSWNDGCNTGYRLPTGRWSHVAVVLGRGRLMVYVNGRGACSRSMSTYLITKPNGPLWIGDGRPTGIKMAYLRYFHNWISRSAVIRNMNAYGRSLRSSGGTRFRFSAVNAVNGRGLGGVTILLSKPGQSARRLVSNRRGLASAVLPSGRWKMTTSKGGYVRSSVFIRSSGRGYSMQRVAMSSRLPRNQLRFVVTWGRNPRDLDSWLRVPGGCLVKYNRKICRRRGGIATLDRDVTGGFGPETVTIRRRVSGTYTYYVHQYSSRGTLRGTVVRIFQGGRTFVYIGGRHGRIRGRVWCVAKVNGRTGHVSQCT